MAAAPKPVSAAPAPVDPVPVKPPPPGQALASQKLSLWSYEPDSEAIRKALGGK